ncbi:hypothetical protein JMJ77_0003201 [Colletotrichum scovillei]|uniref:Uncharacterized protein n=1 Tax=Colletotrichum scovillei TaxID=1209932 RepID=A0A9P7UCX5_9PEZI|nr:hypothetical protein JMJ78_0006413 [Colletotrichum scovillei]KAG7043497.1 hypothetical protein JMJ77_0003201 [Colletotrichum scovillei]KAG7062946.1 hypothetical protein JMJ76_0009787 [Colletotrichum scovillei]
MPRSPIICTNRKTYHTESGPSGIRILMVDRRRAAAWAFYLLTLQAWEGLTSVSVGEKETLMS